MIGSVSGISGRHIWVETPKPADFKLGDWGITCEEDAKLNDEALEDGESRIAAKYKTSKKPIFIINSDEPYDTDENGNVIVKRITTLMYCEEY